MTLAHLPTLTFLKQFKSLIQENKFYLIPRQKNLDFLAEINFTLKNCRDEILKLKPQDYCSGPEKDNDGSFGDIWKFGIIVEDKRVYIKLKISDVEGTKIAKCISFHLAESSLYYPFK